MFRNICLKVPIFRRSFLQEVLYSEDPMFRRSYILKALCSEGSIFRKGGFIFFKTFIISQKVCIMCIQM